MCVKAGHLEPEFGEQAGSVFVRFRLATGAVTGAVTGEVVRLIAVVNGEMRRQELQELLGLKHEDHFREAYLKPAA